MSIKYYFLPEIHAGQMKERIFATYFSTEIDWQWVKHDAFTVWWIEHELCIPDLCYIYWWVQILHLKCAQFSFFSQESGFSLTERLSLHYLALKWILWKTNSRVNLSSIILMWKGPVAVGRASVYSQLCIPAHWPNLAFLTASCMRLWCGLLCMVACQLWTSLPMNSPYSMGLDRFMNEVMNSSNDIPANVEATHLNQGLHLCFHSELSLSHRKLWISSLD